MGVFLKQTIKDLPPAKQDEIRQKSEKLLYFASKTAEGKSDYFGYCVRERRSVLEVFKDFGISKNTVSISYLI
jgi:hypothetical protein